MSSGEIRSTKEDTVKRGKLISLAVLVALTIFIQILVKGKSESITGIIIVALVYLVSVFLGLIWAFNFEVKIKSLPYLFFSSLFVMSEYLFVQLFFAQRFSRIYEGLILLLLVGLVFVGTYVSFLMANVFNVNLYKEIPLVHVGRTTSYIISTFSIFFLTFSFLALQLPIYILIPLVYPIYLFIPFIHLKNLGIEGLLLKRKSILISFLVLFMFIGSFLAGLVHEALALSPMVGYFVGMGVANIDSKKEGFRWELLLYIIALIVVIFINLQLNIFA